MFILVYLIAIFSVSESFNEKVNICTALPKDAYCQGSIVKAEIAARKEAYIANRVKK